MQLLTLNFSMYTVGGVWRPMEWSSIGAKLLYSVFSIVIVFSQFFLTITEFLDIIFVVDNIDDFATTTLMFFTMLAVCCKATIVIVRRNEIINMMQLLLKKPNKPQDEIEEAIQTKFEKYIRSRSIRYSFLATGSITGLTVGSVINILHGQLPYRIWLPWDYHIPLIFYTLGIHQMITLIFACIINVGTETLVPGLFLQTCAQLEILENRIQKLIINKTVKYLRHTLATPNKDEMEISDCIHHHLSIYKFAKTVNVIFNEVLFIQFFSSILVLCTSVYYLSTHVNDPFATASLIMYTICMFAQIFVYCWAGNEVILKILKMSYSAFNILQK
ncbi:hypothetical protein PUN28_012111 [Cardiocondyla obscurior]|uniref:Odorant receptor n=1 Tax=Cardiocondyla obscurior TaxID=286306 RepID=A0AAW2FBY0_9HYME